MKLIDISTPKHPDTFAMVDDADFDWLNRWKWSPNRPHKNAVYIMRNEIRAGKSTCIYMHRAVVDAPMGVTVDHINGNPLDNRRTNLRLCTSSQNACNMRLRSDNTFGFKGLRNCRGKWQFQIKKNKTIKIVGGFKTARDAATAYDEAALELHGPFAKTNKSMGLL